MQLIEMVKITDAVPGIARAIYTFPALTTLTNGTVLLTCRTGSTKDSADEIVELFRSVDGGRTWSEPETPFGSAQVNGAKSSLRACYLTEISPNHLLAASLWIDRETYPGQPLFNATTEGCLPMAVFLADSFDSGASWSAWRPVAFPDEIGPPSLTNPVMILPDGRLVMSIETNKHYPDSSRWYQRVVHFHSHDLGRTWDEPINAGYDPQGRFFNWDQRAGVTPQGEIVTFTWTYDRETNTYLNIQRRLSHKKATVWGQAVDVGFADQPSHPAILPDGRIVLAWVDRFSSQSIRARMADHADADFDAASEVMLYHHHSPAKTDSTDTGEMLQAMGVWSFGLPYAEGLPDGDVAVVYYAGDDQKMDIYCARLRVSEKGDSP